ncbi:MAG: hypothetical protein ACRYE8_05605 [Janthinobacterium lividum]
MTKVETVTETKIATENTPINTNVKFSETTTNYFNNATEHFAKAGQAAINCGMYAGLTATYGTKVLIQGVLGLGAYKEFAGEVMTGHAFGFAMPKVLSGLVAGVVGAIYHHQTAVMAGFVGAAIFASPENAMECTKNAFCTGVEGVKFVGQNLAGIGYGTAGLCNLVYENLPSFNEVSSVELAGSDLTVSWTDAVA